MIVSKLMGGHSNQLFQYAIGRRLAKSLNTELVLDLSWFKDFANVDTPRHYELDCYPLAATIKENLSELRIIDPRQSVSYQEKLKRRMNIGKSIWMYYEDGPGFDPKALDLPNNSLLVGYWQTEKYFADIRHDLLKELEPSSPFSKKNKELIDKINDSESVWMHIRRGDYVTNEAANKFHGVKDFEYYVQALDALVNSLPKDKRKKISIFVCSNDIDWCKKNLIFPYPISYIENELGSDDMRVAKYCKHDILANSSFSWWGAWLNKNPNKIIIAPKRWFENKKANESNDIIPDSWIRI